MTATISEPTTKGRAPVGQVSVPLGTSPRVSLMPPELGERNRQLGIQRNLRLVMVLVLVLVLIGVGAAWQFSVSAVASLGAENQRTTVLQTQRMQYADVDQALNEVALGEAALQVGGSTEIDWQDYLGKVQASLPEGVVISAVTIDAATATSQYTQSTVPLQGARIATLQFTATSATIPEIPDWLNRLSTLPGFVDANPNSVSSSGEGTTYIASITMHIDAAAYSNRLAPPTGDGAATTGDATTNEEAGK